MKLFYFDESSIGILKQEPAVVVAGVMVESGKQWYEVSDDLRAVTDKHFPKRPHFFAWHAKDLFHGSGWTPREKFEKEQRWAILEELCQLIAKHLHQQMRCQ